MLIFCLSAISNRFAHLAGCARRQGRRSDSAGDGEDGGAGSRDPGAVFGLRVRRCRDGDAAGEGGEDAGGLVVGVVSLRNDECFAVQGGSQVTEDGLERVAQRDGVVCCCWGAAGVCDDERIRDVYKRQRIDR